MKLWLLIVALCVAGCGATGSPTVNIYKNVYAGVFLPCDEEQGCSYELGELDLSDLHVEYKTESKSDITADVKKELKDLLKLDLKAPLVAP